jgi:hypothetical protein
VPSLKTAWPDVDSSFERFCLTAGIGAIEQMLCEDARHVGDELVLVAALGIDGHGHKHPLGLIEGATENVAVVAVRSIGRAT